jgi:hypothetical protein
MSLYSDKATYTFPPLVSEFFSFDVWSMYKSTKSTPEHKSVQSAFYRFPCEGMLAKE